MGVGFEKCVPLKFSTGLHFCNSVFCRVWGGGTFRFHLFVVAENDFESDRNYRQKTEKKKPRNCLWFNEFQASLR